MSSSNSGFVGKLSKLKYNADSYPGIPIVEIVDTCRVLIENHTSIDRYDPAEIVVNVKRGAYSISGRNLTVAHMSKFKIVVCGEIYCVKCLKGEGNGK